MNETDNQLDTNDVGNLVDEGESIENDPMDTDFPVEKLSLKDIDFEAWYWFSKFFPPLCMLIWLVLAFATHFTLSLSANMLYLLVFGGTFFVGVSASVVAKVWGEFPSTRFFLRVSLLWTRLFKLPDYISHARLKALQQRRKFLLNSELE